MKIYRVERKYSEHITMVDIILANNEEEVYKHMLWEKGDNPPLIIKEEKRTEGCILSVAIKTLPPPKRIISEDFNLKDMMKKICDCINAIRGKIMDPTKTIEDKVYLDRMLKELEQEEMVLEKLSEHYEASRRNIDLLKDRISSLKSKMWKDDLKKRS